MSSSRFASAWVAVAVCSAIVVGCGRDAIDAAEHIRSLDEPTIDRVRADATFIDGSYVHVLLVLSATDADARGVWCDVVIPAGIERGVEVVVGLDDEQLTYWPPPQDCADPADIPDGRSELAEWSTGEGS